MRFIILCLALLASSLHASNLVDTVKKIKPSIVAIGKYTPLDSSAAEIRGTGFIFANGRYVATNYHVVSDLLDPTKVQYYVALSGIGARPDVIKAEVIAFDIASDLAILKIDKKLTPMAMASDRFIDDASAIAFTGFPIGSVLGLYPSTHRGIIAALTPDATPLRNSKQMSNQLLSRLKNPIKVYQLDATAYPGNSGSPMYLPTSGEVVGIINKVFVAGGKESAISTPTGISYAIPVRHLRKLAKDNGVPL